MKLRFRRRILRGWFDPKTIPQTNWHEKQIQFTKLKYGNPYRVKIILEWYQPHHSKINQ